MTVKHSPPRAWTRPLVRSLTRGLIPAALLACAGAASANTVNVPADYATIQGAINAAAPGDTVLIADGTYTGPGNVDLDTNGKNLTITSQNGAASTIIDCEGNSSADHRGFVIHGGETVTLHGLMIKNGYEGSGGAGVTSGNNSHVMIQNCAFLNDISGYGAIDVTSGTLIMRATTITGGNYGVLNNGSMTLTGCDISGNSGDGVFNSSTATLTNCVMRGNGDYGFYGEANSTLTNCTLVNTYGIGANGTMTLTNVIDRGNRALGIGNGASVSVSHSDIQGGLPSGATNGGGNIDADPLFVSPTDLHLQGGSPCYLAGTSAGAPETDINGKNRPNPPTIGAYEAPAIRSLGLTPNPASVPVGLTQQFTATGTFADNNTADVSARVTWTSSGPSVATINSTGLVSGVARGGSIIAASFGPASATTPVTVTPAVVQSLAVTPNPASVTAGLTQQFTATATYSDNTTADVTATATWASDDPSVATINSTGLATGVTQGTANITASLGDTQSGAVTLTVAPPPLASPSFAPTYQALWTRTDGGFSVWGVADGGAFVPHDFDPAPGLNAVSLADTPDGHAHVLLTAPDGSIQIDDAPLASLTREHNAAAAAGYGPYPGWTARTLAAGPDGALRVLWTRTDGMLSLWKVHADGSYDHAEYGPYDGWTPRLMSAASDSTLRIVWTHASGRVSFWVMDAQGGYSHAEYGPYDGWTPTALTSGPAGTNVLSWTHAGDGQASLWALADSGQFAFADFGPYTDWTAGSLTLGTDGVLHVGWSEPGGAASLWDMSGATAPSFADTLFGPYNGWTLQGLSAAH